MHVCVSGAPNYGKIGGGSPIVSIVIGKIYIYGIILKVTLSERGSFPFQGVFNIGWDVSMTYIDHVMYVDWNFRPGWLVTSRIIGKKIRNNTIY